MMLNLILTHTYFLAEDPHEQQIMKPYPPLGLLYLSAYLKQNGRSVEVYDTTFSTYDRLIAHLDAKKPDVLGIHCNLLTKYTVLKLIRYCRQKNIVSILGGPDAATQTDEFLSFGADIIIKGEGEVTLLTVLNTLEKSSRHRLHGISNVFFKDESGLTVRNDIVADKNRLDDFPFPDRRAIDLNAYLDIWQKHHGQRPVSLITARGCAFTCKWCSHSVYGWTHRRRSPENVVAEIKQIMADYQPSQLWFADDVFTVNKRWLQKFHSQMTAADIKLPFECIARADRLDDEIALILKSLGCYRVWYGAESGSQRVLDAMSRGVTKAEIEQATRICQRHGIEAGIFVMFGYPGELLEDVYETINFVRDLQPDKFLSAVAYPLRGTTLYDEVKADVIYHNEWTNHLQRELDIAGRYPPALYHYAIKKLAADFRRRQLWNTRRQYHRQAVQYLKSAYYDFRIRQLAGD